jgi:hypothetical protein
MATTTPNFGWAVPTSTDLVKDGAIAIETLGDSIDASLVDLKGGTTGQVLAKASNTDMDFSWVTDATGIPATILDAKGDLIAATASDTASRLAVGANGTVLTADSAEATGLKWATPASGGGMTLINTGGTTLTGASVTISSIPSTYQNLQLVIVNPLVANDTEYVYIRINGDSTSNRYASFDSSPANGTFNLNFILGTNGMDNATSQGLSIANFYNYANTTTWKMADVLVVNNDAASATDWKSLRRCGIYNQTGAITSLVLSASSGNLSSGTAYLYGVK